MLVGSVRLFFIAVVCERSGWLGGARLFAFLGVEVQRRTQKSRRTAANWQLRCRAAENVTPHTNATSEFDFADLKKKLANGLGLGRGERDAVVLVRHAARIARRGIAIQRTC